jgi:hypothetical protein
MNELVRAKLIEIARKPNGFITYQSLSDECKLGLVMNESEYARAEIGRILGEISRFEHDNGRPLLSCLVVSKSDNYQGDGFYKLCEELKFGSWKKLRDDIEFVPNMINETYDHWKNDANYVRDK